MFLHTLGGLTVFGHCCDSVPTFLDATPASPLLDLFLGHFYVYRLNLLPSSGRTVPRKALVARHVPIVGIYSHSNILTLAYFPSIPEAVWYCLLITTASSLA